MEERSFFYRDTWAEVDLDCIHTNVSSVKKLLPKEVEIIAVVKANAYGHGDVQVAREALDAGATQLAVAFMDEALALRKKGITAPILVLGASRAEDVQMAADKQITLTVFQKDWLLEAQRHLKTDSRVSVHIKLDTGMGRLGIRSKEEVEDFEQLVSLDQRFHLEGIFTHFATADELNQNYFNQQFELFQELVSVLKVRPKYVHCSNSAATLRFQSGIYNAVRLGIAMYGLTPSLEMEPEIPFSLNEAFSLHSKLVHVKQLSKGDKISYGATYEASGDEWIGTVPVGYADGWIRKLQGQEVLVNGIRVPIVGRICMDQFMVRLPHEVPVGTNVTLIGKDNNQFISVNEIAKKMETINYEVPCIITNRVPRLYIKGGKTAEIKNYLL
ncbi:alanine racemase [Bacillus salipaludis]|uniref:Alanine racemase n=1 Tax=Bacillus salipaludis TaxID=2547811 RepID=A0A4R5VJ55_9BACI|nr:alanine racemase [Bacillus salipaludis]MDQ6595528.1 alanine racemase [Bacillus salipaludis]TDK57188.1 alanine racemase [Bacillus salipaludis]